MNGQTLLKAVAAVMLVLGLSVATFAQHAAVHHRALAANVIVPQSRSFAMEAKTGVEITKVNVGVVIVEQTATTTMDIHLRNPGGRQAEAELIVPVPAGAAVREFAYEGPSSEAVAEVLPKDEAKRIYSSIVAKLRDPAILEFIGYNLVRSSVFPVPAGGTQRVRLTYEHLLSADGDRVDYELPRTESVDYNVPWEISVQVRSKRPISTLYSASHRMETTRQAKNVVTAKVAPEATREPGPFRLSYLVEHNGVSASLLAYPDVKLGGGYFLLLAGLPAELPKGADGPAIKREVTLVLDRSGSMNGEKIEQVREAALQVIAALGEGETFNIIVYNESVESFAPKPVLKTDQSVAAAREYLKNIRSSGGTNIHDALVEALRQKPINGHLAVVLFLTDGLPTVGQTSEVAIRNVAIKANPWNRRIFTFGVGVDVNTPLLDRIAMETRAVATYVLPKEDVEVKVASVFKRLAGPVLADAMLVVRDGDGNVVPGLVRDLMPAKVPDLFEGDQLVLLGKYFGNDAKLTFLLSGNYLGKQRTFRFRFTTEGATTKNAFVPRLWATRRIAVLIDAIRALGADGGGAPQTVADRPDPRLKELVDEIVKLSTEFGILTEYTAFLAREGTNLGDNGRVLNEALRNIDRYAINKRSGVASVAQSSNNHDRNTQFTLNYTNGMNDYQMNRVSETAVQQVNDSTFYHRDGRWVDSRLVGEGKDVKIDRVVLIGSEEFIKLAEQMAKENRASSIAMKGELLLEVDHQRILATPSVERMESVKAQMAK